MAEALVRRCRPLLGTFVEIAVPPGCERAVEPAFAAIAGVQARMSFHEEGSDLAALRRAPLGEAVRVDPGTATVLRLAVALHARSGGLFDVAIGARLVAAGFLPRPPATDLRRMTGTTADIELVGDDIVRCHRPLLIDLGGIAKGFAVDRAVEWLLHAGVERAIVNAGGDLRVIGSQRVTVRGGGGGGGGGGGDPGFQIEIADAALATSANHLGRRRWRNATAVPHLGRARAPVVRQDSISVIARSCMIADAMTKIAMADRPLAVEMLAELDGAVIEPPAARRAA